MLTNDSWEISSRSWLNSHINQNLKAIKSAICQLRVTRVTVNKVLIRTGMFWDLSVCVCTKLVCCSFASVKIIVHLCRCVFVFCRCQTREHRSNVLFRWRSTPELTCVPINTAVTWLTCSPASLRSKHTKIQYRDTLGTTGTGGGTEENERNALPTWGQEQNHYSHPVKDAQGCDVNAEIYRHLKSYFGDQLYNHHRGTNQPKQRSRTFCSTCSLLWQLNSYPLM